MSSSRQPGGAPRDVLLATKLHLPRTPPSHQSLIAALINQLAAQPSEVTLILDDYHLVEARPVHASLGFLLEQRPPPLRLVAATPPRPPPPPARAPRRRPPP